MGSCNRNSELGMIGSELDKKMVVQAYEGVSVKRDWIAFNDIKSFENTMRNLHAMETEEVRQRWEKGFKGYSSWRANLPEELSEDKDSAPQVDIPDAALTMVLNQDGRIQIADTIYQVGMDKQDAVLYAIPTSREAELLKGREPGSISNVMIHRIGLTLQPFFPRWDDGGKAIIPSPDTEICDFPTSPLFPWWGQRGGLIYADNNNTQLQQDNGRQVRIDYHRWRVGFIFYSSAGIRVKTYKHTRLGGWMSTVQMNHVSMQACSKGNVLIPGFIPVPYHCQVSASASNTNKLERTIKWAAAPLHVEVLPQNFNFRFHVNYRGQQISRFIKE
ncbi:MAG: hypothetical protein BGO31_12985 [Bacteroidetes bacterium 43-16]|nr:MAG: hypothetical protein BGO31_12985 [Bacteroidetes bacterium 43-16]